MQTASPSPFVTYVLEIPDPRPIPIYIPAQSSLEKNEKRIGNKVPTPLAQTYAPGIYFRLQVPPTHAARRG